MSESANPDKRIYTVEGSKRILLHAFGRFVHRWQDTLRYEGIGALGHIARDIPTGMLFLFWHNRLFPAIGVWNQIMATSDRRIYGLVSASRDGARLAYFLEGLGIGTIRGSSSRRGAVATRELLKILKEGHHVAITVDGPRGPCYRAQAGAALLLQRTGAPVCFIGCEVESCRTLRSWDRFIVPLPFSRVKIKLDRPPLPPLQGGREQRQAIQAFIQQKLSSLTEDTHRRA